MNQTNPIILFQGDSITDGNRGRSEDPNHILGHGYAHMIAGKLGNDWAERQPLFFNRGISGNRTGELYARWVEDAISLKPDMISLLIGVNDLAAAINSKLTGLDVSRRFERTLRYLLNETQELLPDTKLILCEPFILKVGEITKSWDAWQQGMAEYQEIVKHLAIEYGAIHVPLQETFNQACERTEAVYWIWDGIHPTTVGHDLIARQWLQVVLGSMM